MGRFRSSGIGCLMIIYCVILYNPAAVGAAVYTVGDSSGWSIGADYSTWASDKTFAVGDTLVFNYPAGHTVDEVSANDYKTCTVGNAIASDSSGATSVLLKTAGPHYFMCSAPGHCGGGMKLAVNVVAAAAGVGGANTASPSTTTTSPATTTLAPPTGLMNPAAGTMTQPYSSSTRLSPSAAAVLAFYLYLVFKYVV